MKILSHRGYWKQSAEKNTELAFRRSFDLGFGTETDVRDCLGRLVISHDMPAGGEIAFADFLGMLQGQSLPLALNIKADGLAALLRSELECAGVDNYFAFDMSIPDMVQCLRQGLRVFTRVSDIETEPVLLDKAAGIWLDGFSGEWFGPEVIRKYLDLGKRVCVVSPELHGRSEAALWERIAASDLPAAEGLLLCTDKPEEAVAIFGGMEAR